VDEYYDCLLAGKSGVRQVTSFATEGWATTIAAEVDRTTLDTGDYVSAKLKRRLDPFLTYAMVASKSALGNAGLAVGSAEMDALDKQRCGVLCGSGMGGLDIYSQGVTKLNSAGVSRMSPFFIPYAITNMAGSLVAIDTGFMGPNYSISTACATGNFAINNAAEHIRRGDCDLCLAGGSEAAIVPVGLGGFIACRALSGNNADPTGASRPWDKTRDGFVMGEGAGMLVLESLEHAMARGAPILAEYLGGAQSCDAHHMTEPRQDGSGVRLCIEKALNEAGVAKERVNYINAHATSTPAGDLAEFRAVRSVFDGDVSHMKMNGTKSMIGHALGAAGGLEAVALIKAIETGKVHPTINVHDLEPEVDIDIVANVMQEHKIDVGISNSFGFGGHNSTVVFTGPPEGI
jgi:3-oxoacyl-[acyl-carrier-protein] synthase II